MFFQNTKPVFFLLLEEKLWLFVHQICKYTDDEICNKRAKICAYTGYMDDEICVKRRQTS